MCKSTFEDITIIEIIKQEIKSLFGFEIDNIDFNLFKRPYNLKSYDIMYIIMATLKRIGKMDAKFSQVKLENVSFHSIAGIAQFISNI